MRESQPAEAGISQKQDDDRQNLCRRFGRACGAIDEKASLHIDSGCGGLHRNQFSTRETETQLNRMATHRTVLDHLNGRVGSVYQNTEKLAAVGALNFDILDAVHR
jgi:hypothetical protein